MFTIEDKSQDELIEILAKSAISTKYFCQVFFPEVFFRPFSKIHDTIFDLLDSATDQQIAIAAPRGVGKTSIIQAYQAKCILLALKKFIIPISAAGDVAIEQSEEIKDILTGNEYINSMFPSFKSGNFSKLEWVAQCDYGSTKVLPRGPGQKVRGRKFNWARPDLIVGDDLESDENVETEEQRRKLKRWFFSAVCNSVDRGSMLWKIVVIGTVLHEDSLLSSLLSDVDSPDWTSVRIGLCNDQYESAWPEFMTTEQVRKLADSYRTRGMLDVFAREYRNIPVSPEDRGFKPEYFHSYDGTVSELTLNTSADMINVVLADPARSMIKGSAKTAVVGVGVNIRTNFWYVRKVIVDNMYPDELYEVMFQIANVINATVLAPEVSGLSEYIVYPLKNEMSKRGKFFHLVEVKPKTGKSGQKRSGGLIPLYKQGHVLHCRGECSSLEENLMMWPRPSRWDEIDALAGMLYVLEEFQEYFTPLDEAEDLDNAAVEREYSDIDYEPAIVRRYWV
jgi:hypothetical protein